MTTSEGARKRAEERAAQKVEHETIISWEKTKDDYRKERRMRK